MNVLVAYIGHIYFAKLIESFLSGTIVNPGYGVGFKKMLSEAESIVEIKSVIYKSNHPLAGDLYLKNQKKLIPDVVIKKNGSAIEFIFEQLTPRGIR